MNFAALKYKDDLPLKTIGRIKDVLHGLGLLPVESVWRNSVRGFHSVTVTLAGTDLSTNGKGTSPEYALASAYGEMMERLQNHCTFRLSFDPSPAALAHRGFIYAPDEKPMSSGELLAAGGEWLAAQLGRLDPAVEPAALLKRWQGVTYEELPADFVALPYCNLHTGNISFIPAKMAAMMYMSNGMCAGNTPEEALVQGLGELFERHVNQRIIREKITPPTISPTFIARFPRIAAMVEALEASGDCRVVLKDCSLGQGYPVVGVIYVDRKAASYFVKFGAHPLFEIAAERTLTELLQGQDIAKMKGMREFAYGSASDDPNNIMGIMVNGSGVYPGEFFSPRSSYPFREWTGVQATDNRGLLKHLLGLLAAVGCQAYARDVSFLGFPSFHVIIPNFSEMESFDGTRAIDEYSAYNDARRFIRRLDSLSGEERAKVIDFLGKLPYGPDANVMDFLYTPVSDNVAFPWYYSNLDLLFTALLCQKGDLAAASKVFDRFVDFARHTVRHGGAVTYYRCVAEYLRARAAGRKDSEIAATLSLFYSAEVVKGVMGEFGAAERLVSYQGNLRCFDCTACPFRTHCLHPANERVYLLLKERQAENPIDQGWLGGLARA